MEKQQNIVDKFQQEIGIYNKLIIPGFVDRL